MRFTKANLSLVFVVLVIIAETNAGIFLAIKALKFGVPFLAGAGLLGTVKLALLSKAGLGLGALGTALGAAALKKSHGDDDYYYHTVGYGQGYGGGHGGGYGGGYDHGWRRKRDVSNTIENFDIEKSFGLVKNDDPSQCTERLVCDLSAKAAQYPNSLSSDEIAILSVVKYKPGNSQQKSAAHYALETAMRAGYSGADCAQTYSSCSFNGSHIMSLIRLFTSDLPRNSMSIVKKFIEQ